MINFNKLANEIYLANKEKGFWDKDRNVGELLMLVTSELGEAMEAHRKGKFADKYEFSNDINPPIGHGIKFEDSFKIHIKDTFEDEIADSIIRLLDMAGGMNIDLNFHIQNKLKYNKTREKLHGKKY